MSAQPTKTELDVRLFKVLSHPLRHRILVALRGRVASPSELAEELDESLGSVSYHIKILAENDAVELVETKPVRGALEHFYRPTVVSRVDLAEHWAQIPEPTRQAIFDDNLQEIWQHAIEAASTGGLTDPEVHISWIPLELDKAAFDTLSERLVEVVDLALELHAASAARRAEQGGDEAGRRTLLAIMHFDRAPEDAGNDSSAS